MASTKTPNSNDDGSSQTGNGSSLHPLLALLRWIPRPPAILVHLVLLLLVPIIALSTFILFFILSFPLTYLHHHPLSHPQNMTRRIAEFLGMDWEKRPKDKDGNEYGTIYCLGWMLLEVIKRVIDGYGRRVVEREIKRRKSTGEFTTRRHASTSYTTASTSPGAHRANTPDMHHRRRSMQEQSPIYENPPPSPSQFRNRSHSDRRREYGAGLGVGGDAFPGMSFHASAPSPRKPRFNPASYTHGNANNAKTMPTTEPGVWDPKEKRFRATTWTQEKLQQYQQKFNT